MVKSSRSTINPPRHFCPECGSKLEKRVKNPHNHKDIFCSDRCAKVDRLRYLDKGPKNYLLFAEGVPHVLGVYHKLEDLNIGINYWKNHFAKTKQSFGRMFYELWISNFPQRPKESKILE